MANRHYYSVRTGLNRDGIQFDLGALRRYLRGTYDGLRESGHFQESFGYFCVDEGHVPGLLGSDVETKVAIALRKQDIWPIADHVDDNSEDDCFDVIEFLYDTVSSPVDGWFHQFSGCGWHYSTFDREAGRAKLREEVNAMLRDYQSGWEMSEDGEILALADPGLQTLFEASLPRLDPPRVEDRVTTAIRKFRTRVPPPMTGVMPHAT